MEAAIQENLHFDAFAWKAELQSLGHILDCCNQQLLKSKDDKKNTELQELNRKFSLKIQDVRDKIKYIEQRIAQFENRLTIAMECYISGCETLFYDEVEIIEYAIQKLNRMVDAIKSKLIYNNLRPLR